VPSAAVEIRDLVKTYGDGGNGGRRALDGIDLEVPTGSLLALLGSNGAGKTTTIEICEGFRQADSGVVRVLGLDPRRDGGRLRPRMGVMLQDGVGAYAGARAGELLRLFASYAAHPLNPKLLLEEVGLAEHARTLVKRLSGGQKQRLSLAMALVGRPELIFLDEPTAGMDPHARRMTWELIRRLRADGVSLVLTTHYLDEAEALADQVVMLDTGRVVAAGTPAELTGAGHLSEVRFWAPAGLDLLSLRASLPGVVSVVEDRTGSYLVSAPATPALVAAIANWCAAHDILAEGLAVGRRSLEDVFLDLTSGQVGR
jgi:ABC-2 type transport system ATP-binding protein